MLGMEQENTTKIIKYQVRPTVDFAREAEAEALNIRRNSLDRATLLEAAVKRLRSREGEKKVS